MKSSVAVAILGFFGLGVNAACKRLSSATVSSSAAGVPTSSSTVQSIPTTSSVVVIPSSSSTVGTSSSSSATSSASATPTACTPTSNFYLAVSGNGRDGQFIGDFYRSRTSPGTQPSTLAMKFVPSMATAIEFHIDQTTSHLVIVSNGTILNIANSSPTYQVVYFNTADTVPAAAYQPTFNLDASQKLIPTTARTSTDFLGTVDLTSGSVDSVYLGGANSVYGVVTLTAVCY